MTEYVDLQHCGDEEVFGSSVESVVSTDDDTFMSTGTDRETETEVELKIGLETETEAPNPQPSKRSELTTAAPVPLMKVEDHDEVASDTPEVSLVESEDGKGKASL